jgi:hypothetical protein
VEAEMVFETLGFYPQLTQLVARKDFIEFSRRESFKSKTHFLLPSRLSLRLSRRFSPQDFETKTVYADLISPMLYHARFISFFLLQSH